MSVVTFPEDITSGAKLVTRSPDSPSSASESRWLAQDMTVLFDLVSVSVGVNGYRKC